MAEFNLGVVWEHLGIPARRYSGQSKTRCPFPDHDDRDPSFSVNFDKSVFNCQGCGRSGGVLRFIEYFEGVSGEEARRRAEKLSGGDLSSLRGGNDSGSSLLPQWARSRYGGSGKVSPRPGSRPSPRAPRL